jgi:1-aminocyclopropane-1-carboxylate synthase
VRNGAVAVAVCGDDAVSLPTPTQLDEAMEKCRAEGRAVKAILLTNPSNPLGVIYGEDSLMDAIIWGLANDMHVVVDEVYASSVFGTHAVDDLSGDRVTTPFVSVMVSETNLAAYEETAKTRLHVVYGLSKDFCASGYRVGVLRTRNEGVLRAMDNVAYFCTLPGPMQHAVADMLEDERWVDEFLAENANNLRAQHGALTAALADAGIPVVNAVAGMFAWIDLSGWMRESTWEEENRLWTLAFERAKIVMTPDRDCRHGTPGCFRLCFATVTMEALTTAVGRLKEMLAEH